MEMNIYSIYRLALNYNDIKYDNNANIIVCYGSVVSKTYSIGDGCISLLSVDPGPAFKEQLYRLSEQSKHIMPNGRLSYSTIARDLVSVQPLPGGALPFYDKNIGNNNESEPDK